jgi:CHAD domain-containing protein
MSFTLEPTAPVPDSVRATATNELEQILKALAGEAGLDSDEAAHDVRKRTKKLRALLRLVRRGLGDDVYRRENRALRDAARKLSAVRDAWVLVEVLDDLMIPSTEDLTAHAVAPLRAALVQEHRDLQTQQSEDDTLTAAAAGYERVLARVGAWKLRDGGWGSLEDGLEAAVREGRRRMAGARSRGSVEGFHEWRKQVKYLRHQLELVRPVWPDLLEAMAGTAADIGDLLGTDHDLAVLHDRVAGAPGLSPETRQALVERIGERRRACQREAIALGRKLYSEKPAALARRLGRLWKAAA